MTPRGRISSSRTSTCIRPRHGSGRPPGRTRQTTPAQPPGSCHLSRKHRTASGYKQGQKAVRSPRRRSEVMHPDARAESGPDGDHPCRFVIGNVRLAEGRANGIRQFPFGQMGSCNMGRVGCGQSLRPLPTCRRQIERSFRRPLTDDRFPTLVLPSSSASSAGGLPVERPGRSLRIQTSADARVAALRSSFPRTREKSSATKHTAIETQKALCIPRTKSCLAAEGKSTARPTNTCSI
jgi:hypothetical protein